MGLDNPLHIAFLVVILLLIFGAKRLPEIGRSLGSGMREFKQTVTGEASSEHTALPAAQPQPPAQAPDGRSAGRTARSSRTARAARRCAAAPAPAQPVEHQQQPS